MSENACSVEKHDHQKIQNEVCVTVSYFLVRKYCHVVGFSVVEECQGNVSWKMWRVTCITYGAICESNSEVEREGIHSDGFLAVYIHYGW